MPPKKIKINKADIYLIVSIILMISYAIAAYIIQITTGYTNDQLTICFYTAFGTELLYSCIIKSFNIKNEKIDPNPIDNDGGGVG
jgi:hypothetical protein